MLYVDTSALVKLYIRETLSKEIADFLKRRNQPVPLTRFHELEFSNALRLKCYRAELAETEAEGILSRFKSHEEAGIYIRPPLEWPIVFDFALHLSARHTKTIGTRSLDILHVASALAIQAGSFLTLDERQADLAHSSGLKVPSVSIHEKRPLP